MSYRLFIDDERFPPYVYAVSVHGTPFIRFPLNFMNVVLPGGVKMPQPSEERVNTVFCQA